MADPGGGAIWACPPPNSAMAYTVVNWFSGKISKTGATRCQILRLKCIKFDFCGGSAPGPTGGAYSAPPDPLAVFKRPTFMGRDGEGKGRKREGEGWPPIGESESASARQKLAKWKDQRHTLVLKPPEWHQASALVAIVPSPTGISPHVQPTMMPGFYRMMMTLGFYSPSPPMSLALLVSLSAIHLRMQWFNNNNYDKCFANVLACWAHVESRRRLHVK